MIAPNPKPDADQESARAYESAHNRQFLLQLAVTALALAAYQFSGFSAQLAEGLQARFGSLWILSNLLYLVVTFFGFSVLMFPLSLYSDHVLETRHGMSNQHFDDWLIDFLKSSALEIGLGVVFFSCVYVLLAFLPDYWWIGATIFYVLFSVVLTTIAPVAILPLFHDLEPLEDKDLTSAISEYMQSAGLQVIGIFKWGLAETTNAANAALAGFGRTRRIILSDTLLSSNTRDEILAVLAHEVGHYKHRDTGRLLIISTVLSGTGFYLAHAALRAIAGRLGAAGVGDIAAFPALIFCLLLFSLLTMPLVNTYSRRREFAADAYAVRSMRKAGPLVSALEKLASQNLADRTPAAWIEFLLHNHPSVGRRVQRAKDEERTLP